MGEQHTRGELAKQILALFVVGSVVLTVAVLPGMAHILQLFNAKTAKDRFRIRRSLNGLERRGFVERKGNGAHERYTLTSQGRNYVSTIMLERLSIPKIAKWDNRWRVLMFDIPEEYAHIRREASAIIREMGMKRIQNSVFASPYPCMKEINLLTKHYNIAQYFVYLETDTISSSEDLLKHFHLNK